MSRKIWMAIVGVLALGALTYGVYWFYTAPLSHMTLDRTGTLCKWRGGYFSKEVHQSTWYLCLKMYGDGGRACTDSDQCEGYCIPDDSCLEACAQQNAQGAEPGGYALCLQFCEAGGTCAYHQQSACSGSVYLEDNYLKSRPGIACD